MIGFFVALVFAFCLGLIHLIYGSHLYTAITNFLFWWYVLATLLQLLCIKSKINFFKGAAAQLKEFIVFVVLRGLLIGGAYMLKIAHTASNDTYNTDKILLGGALLLLGLAIDKKLHYTKETNSLFR